MRRPAPATHRYCPAHRSFALDLKETNNASAARAFRFLGMPKDDQWILYGGDEVDYTQGMRQVPAGCLQRACECLVGQKAQSPFPSCRAPPGCAFCCTAASARSWGLEA